MEMDYNELTKQFKEHSDIPGKHKYNMLKMLQDDFLTVLINSIDKINEEYSKQYGVSLEYAAEKDMEEYSDR